MDFLSCADGPAHATTHRVAATERHDNSSRGRASSAIPRLDSAASCNRRVAAMSKPLPSVTTAATAGLRNAKSTAHRRAAVPDGSAKSDRRSAAQRGADGIAAAHERRGGAG